MAKDKQENFLPQKRTTEECRSSWEWIHRGRIIKGASTFIPISDDHDTNDDLLKNLER